MTSMNRTLFAGAPALLIALAAGGCAMHAQPETLATAPAPRLDPEAAQILARNAMAQPQPITLAAGDNIGQEMHHQYVALVRTDAVARELIAGASPDE